MVMWHLCNLCPFVRNVPPPLRDSGEGRTESEVVVNMVPLEDDLLLYLA